jgi:hypothetical protein
LVTPEHIQPPFDPSHAIVCPVHAIVCLRQSRVEPPLDPIHTIVCMCQTRVEPQLDPFQRRGGHARKLLQHGDPGFHIARISAAANGFDGNIRHVHRSVVNGGQSDGAW